MKRQITRLHNVFANHILNNIGLKICKENLKHKYKKTEQSKVC